jgi:hypothetical protein
MNLKTVIAKHLAVSAAPPRTPRTPPTPPRCKNITAKWKGIRETINTAYAAGQQQIDGLTFGTLGQVWEFETWNSQNGNTLPPEIFKFSVNDAPYVPTNQYPPAAAMQEPQLGAPSVQNDPNLAKKEKLLACIKTLRKCALLRGYKDPRSGKYIRGKWDMLYAAAILEAIELARTGCEPYSSAGGMKNPSTADKRAFFKAQINSITEGVRSALGAPCKPCQPTQTAPAGVSPQ